SDRRLLRALLLHAGVPEDQLILVYNIVDKLERDPPEVVGRRLTDDAGLPGDAVAAVLAIFGRSDFESVRDTYGAIEGITEQVDRMGELLSTLESMGLGAFGRFDLGIVRGLAYYTGMVFEIFDSRGELRAVAGGGRYDELLRVVSGTDLPALGFGMGDVVLRE